MFSSIRTSFKSRLSAKALQGFLVFIQDAFNFNTFKINSSSWTSSSSKSFFQLLNSRKEEELLRGRIRNIDFKKANQGPRRSSTRKSNDVKSATLQQNASGIQSSRKRRQPSLQRTYSEETIGHDPFSVTRTFHEQNFFLAWHQNQVLNHIRKKSFNKELDQQVSRLHTLPRKYNRVQLGGGRVPRPEVGVPPSTSTTRDVSNSYSYWCSTWKTWATQPPLDFQPVYIYGRWTSSQNQLLASIGPWCWITSGRKVLKTNLITRAESFWPRASTTEPHWTSKPEPVVGVLFYFCQKTWVTPVWVFNPCTSMGVGHQVRSSCLHQQDPGAESHQEKKFLLVEGINHRIALDIQARTSCWQALLRFPENLCYPPLDFQPVCIYGRWA